MKSSRGFSLIEVLVSIFIIGVMLILLQAVLRSNGLVKMSKNQGIALSIARNEIEILRIGGYDSLPASGSFSSDLLSTIPGAVTELVVDDYNTKTKQVTVQVSWKDSGATSSSTVLLSTLITQVGGLP